MLQSGIRLREQLVHSKAALHSMSSSNTPIFVTTRFEITVATARIVEEVVTRVGREVGSGQEDACLVLTVGSLAKLRRTSLLVQNKEDGDG